MIRFLCCVAFFLPSPGLADGCGGVLNQTDSPNFVEQLFLSKEVVEVSCASQAEVDNSYFQNHLFDDSFRESTLRFPYETSRLNSVLRSSVAIDFAEMPVRNIRSQGPGDALRGYSIK